MDPTEPVATQSGAFINPRQRLEELSIQACLKLTDGGFADFMDDTDPIRHLRDHFHYPKMKTLPDVDNTLVDPESDCIYFCGNSLGLQPKTVRANVERELDKWERIGVHGHMSGKMPWALCDEVIEDDMTTLVGGIQNEVGLMNGLTVNLHLMMISFYEPTPVKYKILCEGKAFPSDHYAFQSQISLRGYDPDKCLITIFPRKGEHTLRMEDILAKISEEGDSIALICFSGVQYYTGQLFDMESITKAGHSKDCMVGFDLAHAVGNVPLHLHDWGVDFAVWCTYKYLCSGAGGIAGAFIHEKHHLNKFHKLSGWWGHKMETRFRMDNDMDLEPGIHGYRISNPPPLLCASLEASLEIYKKTSMDELREKSMLLTAYLETLLLTNYAKPAEGTPISRPYVDIITPSDPQQRGCQLSVMFSCHVTKAYSELKKRGVVCDKREPNVLRLAPKPIYNSFKDVHRFIEMLHDAMEAAHLNEEGAQVVLQTNI